MYLNSGESSNEIPLFHNLQIDAPVKPASLFCFVGGKRFIFAVAYGADAQFGYPLPDQCLFDGIGPLDRKNHIVGFFACAVGITVNGQGFPLSALEIIGHPKDGRSRIFG